MKNNNKWLSHSSIFITSIYTDITGMDHSVTNLCVREFWNKRSESLELGDIPLLKTKRGGIN